MRTPFAALVAVALIATCCGGDGNSGSNSSNSGSNPTGPSGSASGLQGTWKATKAEFVSAASSSKRVDVVTKGTSVTLALTAGDFVLTMTDPGQAAKVTNGTWTASSDVMNLRPAGMTWSWQFDMTLSGNTLTLNGASVEFDFAANGVMEQAKLYMTLTRQ